MGAYQVNPNELIQMIKGGSNPQQLLMSVLEGQMASTPMGQNLLQLVKNGQTKGIEQIARNLCQERGLDFEREFSAFRQMLGR